MSSDGLEAFTGDRAAASVLRRSLQQLAEEHADAPLGEAVRQVLAGQRHVRELAEDPNFAALTARGMRAQEEAWAALTPQERAEHLQAGEAYLARLDHELDD